MEDFLRAIHNAVKEAGASEIAEKMGLSHVSLLQRANPDNDAHKLTVNHLHQILQFTEDMRILEVLANRFGFDLVAKDRPEATGMDRAMLSFSKEMAEVTLEVHKAMADGRICQIEKQAIRREIAEARVSLDQLEESVKVA